MGCPYCGSGNWGYDGRGSPELTADHPMYVIIRRRCECLDCGKKFFIRELYKNDDLCYFEKIPEED